MWVVLVVLTFSSVTFGQAARDDRLALSAIFGEQHVDDSTWFVHRQAMQLAGARRYDYLMRWILPGAEHATLRMQVGYAPTNPAPLVAAELSGSSAIADRPRRPAGGGLISPVYDLLDIAKELNRLDAVRSRVAEWDPGADESSQQMRAAMLVLIELAREDSSAAAVQLEAFLDSVVGGISETDGPSPSEMLVYDRGLDSAALRESVGDVLSRYQPWINSEYHRSTHRRHVSSMLGRLHVVPRVSSDETAVPITVKPLKQWFPVSKTSAATRGPGSPLARWVSRPGFVENIASHDDDYLYFAVPLRGDFEVECDVTAFNWRDSNLAVAGIWLAPVYTHAGFDIGSFRRNGPRIEISPPLTKIRDWFHYRTVVRDARATTYVNGRKIHEEPLDADHDPWLAIRSTARHDGAVRNLRITGTPTIPKELNLSRDRRLDSWLPYYEGATADGGVEWQQSSEFHDSGKIMSNRPSAGIGAAREQKDEPGYQESLLRYHRPMLEDGTITYEFLYIPGTAHVHPALDRLAFLLQSDGVRVHWVTDGPFDQTGLSPSNVSDEPQYRRGPDQLPLKSHGWNEIQVQLQGDVVTLVLNGEVIYERPLEATNQRTFGLFHFADRTQVRVRDVVWRGEWPQELPKLAEQELAVPETQFLDEHLDKLADVFEHDFAKAGLPAEQFHVLRGDSHIHVKAEPTGVLAYRPGTGGYRNATISPNLSMQGDFDITVEYNRFQSNPAPEGSGSVMLFVKVDNTTADEGYVARRLIQREADRAEQVVHCVRVSRPKGGDRREYFGSGPMEERSGRLRLARRGDQLYYLTSEGDSPNFQLRAQRTFPSDDTPVEGIQLVAQIHQLGGATSVIWRNLVVRAEKLSGPAVEDFDTRLTEMNRQRDQLPAKFVHDFAEQAPTDDVFYRWADRRPWNKTDGGLTIVAPGSEEWTSAGLTLLKQVSGDFDIVARFDVLKFDMPKAGERCSAYLQVQFPDKDQTQISMIFTNNATGATEVIVQVREPIDNDKYNYRLLGGMDLASATALRILRRGTRMTFFVSSKDLEHDRIVGEFEVPGLPILRSNIRFMVHTGGAGLESRVKLKSIAVHATEIQPETVTDVAPEPQDVPADAKGVLERVLDLFK